MGNNLKSEFAKAFLKPQARSCRLLQNFLDFAGFFKVFWVE